MDDAQIHLMLNHIPIIGSFMGIVLLAFGVFRRDKSLLHAGFITLIIVAIITFPVVSSGHGAEEIVEEMGISHDLIEAHEALAGTAFWMVEVLGLLAVIGLILSFLEHKAKRMLSVLTLILGLIVFFFLVRVGDAGGEIHHPELRESAVSN